MNYLNNFITKDKNKAPLESFLKAGLPTPKEEKWKYVSLEKFFKDPFSFQESSQAISAKPSFSHFILFSQGQIVQKELPAGLTISEKEISASPDEWYQKVNTSLSKKHYHLEVSQDLDSPVHLIFETTGDQSMAHVSLSFSVKANKTASFIEEYLSNTDVWVTSQVQVEVAQGAKLDLFKLQKEDSRALHFAHMNASLARDSAFQYLQTSLGGRYSRQDLTVNLLDQGAEVDLLGLYALKDEQHSEHYSTIHHHKGNTQSNQFYKGILNDRSTGVFQGTIKIQEGAQQVQSHQLNKNLLLSQRAKAHTMPTLLVDADDVKCAHGATVGQIDPEQLFYLESRGIAPEKAFHMLSQGFALDVLQKINQSEAREYFFKEMDL